MQVLHPGETLLAAQAADNDNSLVLRLTYGKASFLLAGDLLAEAHLLRQPDLPPDSTVLKVTHRGAETATTLRFQEAVTLPLAFVSIGAGNRFGHPAPEVLERLDAVGAEVWRTDECGDWAGLAGARIVHIPNCCYMHTLLDMPGAYVYYSPGGASHAKRGTYCVCSPSFYSIVSF